MLPTFNKHVNFIMTANEVKIEDFEDVMMVIKDDLKNCDLCGFKFEKGFLLKVCNHAICPKCFKNQIEEKCFCNNEIRAVIQLGKNKKNLGFKSKKNLIPVFFVTFKFRKA